MPELMHSKHVGLTHAEDSDDLVFTVPIEQVSGGDGFEEVNGSVTLDLATGRAFYHTMTGNITDVTVTNVPTVSGFNTVWTWVLKVNNIGSYSLSSPPSVTWVDGSSWADVNLLANAVNVIQFIRVNDVTYASLAWNGELARDPYKVCFLENGTVSILTEAESVDVANATKNGDGTITYTKNGSAITVRTSFAVGDRLGVVCGSATGTTTVRVPRYAL